MEQRLVCIGCGAEFPFQQYYECPVCGDILSVKRNVAPERDRETILMGDEPFRWGMWKYKRMLPPIADDNVVTLGEGETPLISDQRLPELWGAELDFRIKAESVNPTGSFKDRPTSVGISVAKEWGQKTVIVSSSGNAGAAVSAYAAKCGMESIVLVPAHTDQQKLAQIQAQGARVIGVHGTFSDCFFLAKELAREFQWTNLVSTYLNPYTVEANKTIAYELYHQMRGNVPDHICIPIGTGPLLAGILKGFRELQALGLTKLVPKMIGVQVTACEPITRAFVQGVPVEAWKKEIHTKAEGISDALQGYERDGNYTIRLIRETNGTMVSISEAELDQAKMWLDQKVGLYSEPTGAASVAAIPKLYQLGFIKPGERVISVMTGHGLKHSGGPIRSWDVVTSLEQAISLFRHGK